MTKIFKNNQLWCKWNSLAHVVDAKIMHDMEAKNMEIDFQNLP